MKLRRKNEGLSDSLLNNSQVKEADDVKIDILKSEAVIRASKDSKVVSKLNFVKSQNAESSVKCLTMKSNRRKTVLKPKNIDIEDVNKSLVDLVIPKKKSKLTQPSNNDNPRSSNVNISDLQVITISSSTEIFSPDNPSTHENQSSNEVYSVKKPLFKTPLIKHEKKSVKSPLCASSPIFGKRKSSNLPESEPDLFSSEIISSSEDFKSCKSSITSKKSMLSDIKDSQIVSSRRKTTDMRSSSVNRKIPIKKPKIMSRSLPDKPDSIVRTKSGRISRTFHQTETGKFIYQLFYESFHKIK